MVWLVVPAAHNAHAQTIHALCLPCHPSKCAFMHRASQPTVGTNSGRNTTAMVAITAGKSGGAGQEEMRHEEWITAAAGRKAARAKLLAGKRLAQRLLVGVRLRPCHIQHPQPPPLPARPPPLTVAADAVEEQADEAQLLALIHLVLEGLGGVQVRLCRAAIGLRLVVVMSSKGGIALEGLGGGVRSAFARPRLHAADWS